MSRDHYHPASEAHRALHALNDQLCVELEPLGDLIAGAIGALSPADTQWAVSHLAPDVRQRMMRHYAMPPMRNPTTAFATQVTARLARQGGQEQHAAARALTKPLHGEFTTLVSAPTSDVRAAVDQLFPRFPQGVVRLYLAAYWPQFLRIDPRIGPRIVRELVEDERLALGAWAPFAEQVVAACDAADAAIVDVVGDAEPMDDVALLADVDDHSDNDYEALYALQPEADSAGSVDEVQAAVHAAHAAFTDAGDALDSIASSLGAGEAPSADALHVLGEVSAWLDEAAHQLGLEVPPPVTLARIEAAAQRPVSREDHRELLTRLSGATGQGACAPAVERAATEARALIAAASWDDVQRSRADRLARLVALVDAVTREDDDEATRCHDELLATGEFARAMLLAAIRGRITLGPTLTSAPTMTSSPIAESGPTSGSEPLAEASPTHAPRESVAESPATTAPEEQVGESSVEPEEVAPGPATSITADPGAASLSSHVRTSDALESDDPATVESTTPPTLEPATNAPTLVAPSGEIAPADLESTVEPAELVGVAATPWDAAEIDAEVAVLIREGRLALAAWMLDAVALRPELSESLRVAALVNAVRSPVGPSVTELERRAGRLSGDTLRAERPAQVLAVAAALRSALLFPQGTLTGIGVELGSRVGEIPGLAEVLAAVIRAAQRGLSITVELLPAASSVATLEQLIRDASTAAGAELAAPRSSTFVRSRQILNVWCGPGGVATALLAPARDDDRTRRNEVEVLVRRFVDRREVENELDRVDATLRSGGSKRIEGQARRLLIERLGECTRLANDWLEACARLEAHRPSEERWQEQPLRELRSAIQPQSGRLLSALHAIGEAGSILRATGQAAAQMLAEIFALLDGQPLLGPDQGPAMVLNGELLKATSVPIDPESIIAEGTAVSLGAVREAAERSWRDGFEERCAHEDFAAASLLVERIRLEEPDLADELAGLRQSRLEGSRDRVGLVHRQLVREVNEARRCGFMDEDTWGTLTSAVNRADPAVREDVGHVESELARVAGELVVAHEGEERLFTTEFALKCESVPAVAAQAPDITRMAERGDLATARDMMSRAEAGEEALSKKPIGEQIAAFYPEVPVALAQGLTLADADAVKAGGRLGPMDFAEQSSGEREVSARGVRAWVAAKTASPPTASLATLAPALRLMGIEADSQRTTTNAGGAGRRWLELVKVRRTGRALVPAFGSASGSNLLLLCCWGSPDITTVLGWVAQDRSERPIFVLYFGTVSPAQRQALARSLREQARRAVAVVDDAVLAFTAAYGNQRFEALMFVTLPFTAVNPYEPGIAGSVPPEMFYGRTAERSSVTHDRGTSLIYGGRQLGKSALLHSSEQRFEEAPNHEAIYVDLDPASIGPTRRPEALWDRVLGSLATAGITAPKAAAKRDSAEQVAEAVRTWLKANDDRRLLLLLDECDAFFDADAEARFVNTTRLRALMDETQRHFKVVFAGLHQVQRFAAIPNQPLAHLGRPQVIGPLAPQPALDLLQRPLEGLGFELSNDLATRLMASSNYQPLALQVYGQALVERLLKSPVPDELPVHVSDDDVEALLGDDGLTQQIFERFRLTLRLDPRYRVIAYTMAHQARQVGYEKPITAEDLRRECQMWWKAGFAQLRPDEFRSLIEEMAGLGVLTTVSGGWRLRSPNLLRMFGTVEQIEEALIEADMETPPTGFASQSARRRLEGESRTNSPLSEAQLAELLSNAAPPVQVVLGSEACGVSHVEESITAAAGTLVGTVEVVHATDRRRYRRLLASGAPGQHVVVLSAPTARGEAFDEAIETALSTSPPDRATRSVVLVVPTFNLSRWPNLLARQDADVAVAELRRHDARSLSAWALDVPNAFQDERTRRELLEVTGGWPCLVDSAATMATTGRVTPEILDDLRADLLTPDGAARLILDIGLENAPDLASLWEMIAEFGELPERLEDLASLAEGFADPRSAVEALRALGVLDVAPDGGLFPEQVALKAWRLTRRLRVG